MIVAKIRVDGVRAHAVYRNFITAGIIGAQVEFDYAEAIWQGLHKTIVFKSNITKDVVTDANIVTIPAEVVAAPATTLQVGVYGVDANGNLAIPTLWADLGNIRDAANPSGDTTTDPSLPVWAQIQAMIGNLDDLDTTVKSNLVAAINEALTKSGGEVDPAEIQQIVGDYLAANPPTVTETDPTIPAWAKEAQKPSYTASEVGADPSGTAASQVSTHNTGPDTHSDIRMLIHGLTDRLNALADSDDITLDQLSEVVAYIKSNRSLIDAITTSKVSVADIVDNLTTNVSNKPLSAAQGVVIKTLIDALRNDKLDAAELTNAINTALAQAKASGEFDGATGPQGPKGATGATGPAGADGKSAYAYAVEGGYTGTEEEFTAKLAAEKFANPNALTFTGAVTGSYDGSQPLTVNIPSGGGAEASETWEQIATAEISAPVRTLVINTDSYGNSFLLKKWRLTGTTTGYSDAETTAAILALVTVTQEDDSTVQGYGVFKPSKSTTNNAFSIGVEDGMICSVVNTGLGQNIVSGKYRALTTKAFLPIKKISIQGINAASLFVGNFMLYGVRG